MNRGSGSHLAVYEEQVMIRVLQCACAELVDVVDLIGGSREDLLIFLGMTNGIAL